MGIKYEAIEAAREMAAVETANIIDRIVESRKRNSKRGPEPGNANTKQTALNPTA